MLSIEEFHEHFVQSILSQSEAEGALKASIFFESICEKLYEIGDLTHNYQMAEYRKKGIEVFGYDYDEEREVFSLIVHELFQKDIIQTVTRELIQTKFNRLKKFFSECTKGLYKELESAFPAYELAELIFRLKKDLKISKLNLIFITDGKITRTLNTLAVEEGDIRITFKLIDIEYLFNIYQSENSGGNFIINTNLPSLLIDDDDYVSYLCVINGEDLYNIYEDFGQKIFEQNVRTFLQFRGNVNKGLKNTIQYSPNNFFAYNNGLTATASKVHVDLYSNISAIENLQIVNGCQTTSAIYAAKKISKLDISKISLQMKLSVLKNNQKQNDFVAKVAEYANTQNKVNKSDFFSNHPFHLDLKEKSKKILAPSIGGSQKRTKWFYERVRGEFLNDQAFLSKTEKDKFLLENPKSQLFDKTFLAKTENIWRGLPHKVSKGKESSFPAYAEFITDKYSDELEVVFISDNEFKEMIARIILFKSVEKEISKADWYNGGYRAQAVAYTISYFSNYLKRNSLNLNFNKIWEEQAVPSKLIDVIITIAAVVYENLLNPPLGNANVSSWCKKEDCWKSIQQLKIAFKIDNDLLIDRFDKINTLKESKAEKKIDSSIEKQIFVLNIEKSKWNKLRLYYSNNNVYLNNTKKGVLENMSNGSIKLPSEKQSIILYELYYNASHEGFSWD